MVCNTYEQLRFPMGVEGMVCRMLTINGSQLLITICRVPDLSLPSRHPKRNFIRRAIEIEIRLAYFDRIQKTLPEAYQVPGTDALPDEAPGPEFTYDDPRK